jgi:DNA adenine methylase
VTARPFLKWAGGKTQLLPEIRARIPKSFGRYYEPFVGGGAVFFDLASRTPDLFQAVLSDDNPRLVRAYLSVRDDIDALVNDLRGWEKAYLAESPEGRLAFFMNVRHLVNTSETPREIAAAFIFLNKTCFNGLHRVNGKGDFNVPHGRYEKPVLCDEENLRACSVALRGVRIRHAPFHESLYDVRAGDFVYADPPYWPVSKTSSFTGYAKGGFGPEPQGQLRDLARRLKDEHVHVLLSNADVPEVRELYEEGFTVERVEASRAINSKGGSRGKVGELLIS